MVPETTAREKTAPEKTAHEKRAFNPLLALLGTLATLFFIFPLVGLIAGAPEGHITSVITSQTAVQALELSIVASLASTALAP
jgi:ABC-type sulfate transport system permease component